MCVRYIIMKDIRFKRCAAWFTDWLLSCFPCLLFTVLFRSFFERPSFSDGILWLFVLLVLWIPLSFIFRDVIWKGRSVGKRLFFLQVLDARTHEPASNKQKTLRKVFFFLYPIDFFILLSSYRTIGDQIAHTIVVVEKG